MIVVAETAIGRYETGALEIKISIHLVLVPRQHIFAHDIPLLEIAATMEIIGIIDAAGAIVDRGLRIRADRAGAAGRRRGGATTREQRLRRHALLDPFDKSAKRIDWNRTAAIDTAVPNAGRTEQTIEAL